MAAPFVDPERPYAGSEDFLHRSALVDGQIAVHIVCPISTKNGGNLMIRSATPQTITSVPRTIASRLSSGPSMNSSMTARPVRDTARAAAQASRSSSSESTRRTAREPMLSAGFTTSGRRSARRGNRGIARAVELGESRARHPGGRERSAASGACPSHARPPRGGRTGSPSRSADVRHGRREIRARREDRVQPFPVPQATGRARAFPRGPSGRRARTDRPAPGRAPRDSRRPRRNASPCAGRGAARAPA